LFYYKISLKTLIAVTTYGWLVNTGMGNPEKPTDVTKSSSEPATSGSTTNDGRRKLRINGYITLLKDPNLTFRWKAAEALGIEGDSTAVEPLITALKDPFVDVQWLAAKSLGKIGDHRAVEPLIESLKSEEKWLRTGAAWGLGKLRDPRAVDPLLRFSGIKRKLSGKLPHGLSV
jgi:HEAT repeat protein